jgi:hypothetical protein
MSDINRRHFYRVKTRVQAYSRRMQNGAEPPLFRDALDNTKLSERDLTRLGKLGLPLGSFLNEINTKLDMLFQLSYLHRLHKDFPFALEVTELSGSGLKFSSQEKFEIGQRMEIVLILGQVPPQYSSMVGEITRISHDGARSDYILKFTDIRESNQDAIVKFIFQEQGQKIRSARME